MRRGVLDRVPDRVLGPVLVLALLALYVLAWRPARALWAQHVAFPALTSIRTERSAQFEVSRSADRLIIEVRAKEPGLGAVGYRAPGGILMLLPVVVLAGWYPGRSYWMGFWVYELVLGGVLLGAVAAGIGWGVWGFTAYRFLNGYLVPAVALAVPLVVGAEKLKKLEAKS